MCSVSVRIYGSAKIVGLKLSVSAPQQQIWRFRVSCSASDRFGSLFYANWDGIGEGATAGRGTLLLCVNCGRIERGILISWSASNRHARY